MSNISRIHQSFLSQTSSPSAEARKSIDALKTWNPHLNALVRSNFEWATSHALHQTESLSPAYIQSKPLLGIPCTIKECFAWKGMPHSSGLKSRQDVVAHYNAPTVQRLLDAGALPIGSTNLSELCMWMESHNTVYGRTNNPYDLHRTVGGSSGGEGAMVGSGCVPFGLGSDIGGSIRMPAFFCGVFGHKPTPGLVPNSGQYPNAEGDAQDYLCTGPLTQSAQDLMPILKVLSDRDDLVDPSSVDLSSLVVYSMIGDGRRSLSKELRKSQAMVAQTLSDHGLTVIEHTIPEFKYSVEIWSAALEAAGGVPFRELLFEDPSHSVLFEILRFIFGASPHTFPALGLVLIEDFGKRFDTLKPFVEQGIALRKQFHDLLGKNSVFLYPSHAQVAPKHRKALLPPWNWAYTAILNIMKVPVTQVPLGLNRAGIPLGVQVAAGPHQDHLSIALAIALEREFGGWVEPPKP